MQRHANPLLVNAHALPVDINEPHAQVGNHVRVSSHPLLGLPVTPFVIYRAVPDSRKILVKRNTASYQDDATGQQLFPPFNMVAGQSVTVTIALGANEACIWAQLIARGERSGGGGEPQPAPIDPPGRIPGRIDPPGRIPGRVNPTLPGRVPGVDRPRVNLPPGFANRLSGGFYVEAFMSSAIGKGAAIIGRRSDEPFSFSAPNIVQLRVHGAGQVFGIQWIEAHEEQKLAFEPYTVICFPHKGGPRYLPINNPIALAAAHTALQAPKRLPLQETDGIPAPAAAPTATVAQDVARVASLIAPLKDDLDALLTDTSVAQLDQSVTDDVTDADGNVITDENGDPAGSSTTMRLQRFFGALADPGTATGIGYKLRDPDFVEVQDRIVFYKVFGFFEDFKADPDDDAAPSDNQIVFDSVLGTVHPDDRNLTGGEVRRRYEDLVDKLNFGHPAPTDLATNPNLPRYVMLRTMAVADRLAPLDQPEPVEITGTVHKAWLPGPPPDAKREVEVQLACVRLAGLLAGAKRTPAGVGGDIEGLNRANGDGFHLPIILGHNIDDETGEPVNEPGTGFIADRDAAASSIDYAVAQQDRFGRWSEWSRRVAPAGERPKPPRPVLQAYYQQPAVDDAATTGGAITVHVAVPDAEDLAPGSLELSHARVFIADPVAPDQQHDLAEGAKVEVPGQPGSFRVTLNATGPVLALLEERRLVVTARWFDTGGNRSDLSEEVRLNLVDPRPPLQLTVPPFLLYSARPDVTGLAWIEHRWTGQAGVKYGIYYTDENRLRAHLEASNEAGLLAQIDAAGDAAVRAGVYRDNAALFPDYLYERLDDAVVDFAGNEVGFRHAVSGSLRVLSAYKIAVETESGARPDLSGLPIILYGVPNSDPPQQPVLKLTPAVPQSGEPDYVVEAEIAALTGVTQATTWRLRRTRTETRKLTGMPVVATGPMGASDPDTGRQNAIFRDGGPVVIAPTAQLTPWTRYTYRAEIQGAPESGSAPAVPGRWSAASEPVTITMIPEGPPDTPAFDQFSGTAAADGLMKVELNLSHPQRLSGGSSGYYTMRIDRRLPGAALERLGSFEIREPDEPLVFPGFPEGGSGEVVPMGTTYVVTLVDPLGRAADPLTVPLN